MSARSTCSRAAMRDGSIAYTFRGSEYGMCSHRHVACLRGLVEASIDAKTRKMFDAGNRGEALAKTFLNDLAKKDPRLVVEEFATGWQNQTSVNVIERRDGFDDGITRELRLICSPDGRLAGQDLVGLFGDCGWLKGSEIGAAPTLPRRYALEVKCYGKTSMEKFIKKGAASNETLEWQTSGVAGGYEREFQESFGVVVMALRRDEVKDADGNFVDFDVPADQTPAVWVYDKPKFTPSECLQRCWDVVKLYESGGWAKCTNSFFCRYPHRPTPVIDVVAEAMLESMAEAWERFQQALRDAEGLFIGAQNGDDLHGFRYCRSLLSVPMVRPIGA